MNQSKEQPPVIWPFPTYKGEPYKVKVKPEAKPEKGLEYLGKALF